MSLTTTRNTASSTIPREHTVLLSRVTEKPFEVRLDDLLSKLKIILDYHIEMEDEFSLRLFDYAVCILTIRDSEQEEKTFIKTASKVLAYINDALLETQINIKALDADLPVDIDVSDFAKNMVNWLAEARGIIGYFSEYSIEKIDFSVFPKECATKMYNSLLSKTKRITKLSAVEKKVAPIAQEISEMTKFLRVELKKQQSALEQSISESQKIINDRINLLEQTHQLDLQELEFRLRNNEHELTIAAAELAQSNRVNEFNTRQIRDLISAYDASKQHAKYLKSRIDDDKSEFSIF